MSQPGSSEGPDARAARSPLSIGIAGCAALVETDTAAGRECLERDLRAWLTRTDPRASCGVSVELGKGPAPVIRAWGTGGPIDLALLFLGPEWKRFRALPHPTRILYSDEALDSEPALEVRDGGWHVLAERRWPHYAFLAAVWLLLRENPLLNLHAGTCGFGGHAALLLGPSGSGKSTLAWALQAAGADCFGDEWAFFTLPDYRLHAVSSSLNIRPGGAAVIGPDVEASARWRERKPGDPKHRVRLRAAAGPCPEDRVSLFFLDGLAASPETSRMPAGEAVRRVLQGMGYGDPSVAARLDAAAGLIDRCRAWRLKVGSPADTAALVLDHLRDAR